MKQTIIKAVTAIVCVAIFCSTITSALTDYGTAMKDIAASGGSSASFADGLGGYSDNAAQGTVGGADSSISTDGTGSAPDESQNVVLEGDPTEYSKEQAVRYYTESMHKSYNYENVEIKKTEVTAISIDYVTPGGDAVARFANKIVETYAKTNEETKTFVNGGATDDPNYKATNYATPVDLDPRGAKTATVTKKGNDYEINILVVPEAATLERPPVYNKQCFFPLDLSTVDLFGLTVTQADFNYSGTTIKAVVTPDGYVKSAEIHMPLSGKGGGNFLAIKGSAEVSGSFSKVILFTY